MSTDTSEEKKRVPFLEGLFVMPSEGKPGYLVGSRCHKCGEVLFPKRDMCGNCLEEDTEEIALSSRGKIAGFTVVRHQPPAPYKGPEPFVPFGLAEVELPEGLSVLAQLAGCDVDSLKINTHVDLTFENQYQDEQGDDVVMYKFKPV